MTMSNRRKLRDMPSAGSIPAVTVSVRRWQIRIQVSEPWKITDFEVLDRQDFNDVAERCMVLASRASFMVNGPNRHARWAIDLWDADRQEWRNVCMGVSHLKDRAKGIMPTEIG